MTGQAVLLAVAAVLAGAVLGALGVYAVAFSVRKKSEAEELQAREDLKGHFSAVSSEALRNATDQFLKLAESRLSTERVRADAGLDEKRKAVETAVSQLQERLKSYEELMRRFEADRGQKYGSLEEQLRKTARTTEQLQETTSRLYSVLTNSRARGQWGERMAEDILRAVGLLENVQYVRNRVQDTAATRPDFTFMLPDGHKLHMDVKFPLDNYLRMCEAAAEEEKARFKNEFLKDVRARVKELTKRSYVNPEERTLDYLVLFIPNEQVYAFTLESLPGIVDEALAQKVVLASPFSLYALLAVVRQAFENFHFSQATRDVIKFIGSFRQAYEKFKGRLDKLGEQIDRTAAVYAEVTGPSYKMLDQAVARIEKVREGGDQGGEKARGKDEPDGDDEGEAEADAAEPIPA